jgi:hypothetical protein
LGELDELGVTELARWAQYWIEEPWGSVRDNMHAGLIITELMKPHLPEGVTMSIDQFMLKSKAELDVAARARIVAALSAMAAAGERAARREKKP